MKIGLHISTQGDPIKALRAFEMAGGQAAQIFSGNPRRFMPSKKAGYYDGDMSIVVHSSYVINLGLIENHSKALPGAVDQFKWAQEIGADWYVLHAGSTKNVPHSHGLYSWRKAIDELLAHKIGGTRLAIENMAQGRPFPTAGSLGNLETVAHLVQGYSSDDVSICLDTAHAWGAGENLRALAELGSNRWIRLFHANIPNAGIAYGSRLDRHDQHIQEGAFPVGLLVDIMQSIQPEVAILESMVHTVQDCQYLYDLVMHSNGNVK